MDSWLSLTTLTLRCCGTDTTQHFCTHTHTHTQIKTQSSYQNIFYSGLLFHWSDLNDNRSMWCELQKKTKQNIKAWRPHGRDAAGLTWCSVAAAQIKADSATLAMFTQKTVWHRMAWTHQRKTVGSSALDTGKKILLNSTQNSKIETHEISKSISRNLQFITGDTGENKVDLWLYKHFSEAEVLRRLM